MIGITSFARTRYWGIAVLIIMATAALIYACGPLSYSLNPSNGYLVAVAAQLPLVPAIAIQATLYNEALHKQERLTSRRRFGIFRVLHVALLTGLAAATIAVAASYIHAAPDGTILSATFKGVGSLAIVRNLLALTGAALIAGYILGSRFGWTVPLAWAVMPYFVTTPQRDPDGIVTLLGQPDTAVFPLLFAVLLIAVGLLMAASRRGGAERIF